MKITKKILDHKVKKHLKATSHKLTFRQCIMKHEDELGLEHADLDSMTDEELNNYDNDLWEKSL